ncbi:MAG: diaminopimelate decarboxylase, partial [Clostridia bacterium]|nr:diaminopimelate decarboxylase [Clostridia bacterium]
MICDNILVNENGHLEFSGHDTLDLAQQYETPLYVMDERLIRARMSEYRDALAEFFPQGSVPEFASKAFSCKRIYEIAKEEKIHIDVVSCGELYTALKAGFPMEDCFFHGNNKTDKDIRFAMQSNVGHFVVDSFEEIEAVNRIAGELKLIQKVMLRICPGIDPHTHKKISTGSVESKFGFAIETGMAFKAVANALSCENIDLRGFHCHIGSQIFDSEPFCDAAQIMLDFMDDVRKIYGFTA